MRIEPTRVTCAKCAWVGDVELVVDAPIDVAVASMRSARCGNCGSSKIGFGGEMKDGKPGPGSPVTVRASWWRSRGDRGLSSMTIHGMPDSRLGATVPLDPDDFQRCKKLLDLIPEWRPTLNDVAKRHAFWKPMLDAWDEFERLWAEESPSGTCPKLYAAMKRVRKECDEIEARRDTQ